MKTNSESSKLANIFSAISSSGADNSKDITALTIKLNEDITLSSKLTINPATTNKTSKITIDLNGHNIKETASNLFEITSGDVTITGTGTITGKEGYSVILLGSDTNSGLATLKVDKNVIITNSNGPGIRVAGTSNALYKICTDKD